MSYSNFSIETKLRSLPVLSRHRQFQLQRVYVGYAPASGWFLELAGLRQPVLLLQHRCLWADGIAGLTLRTERGLSFSVWFSRRDQPSAAWRRLRTRFQIP